MVNYYYLYLLHYNYSVPYKVLLILHFMQGEVQSASSKCAHSLIDQRLLGPVWR